eukprot:gene7458-599_t
MAALSQCRVLSGSKAFVGAARPRQAKQITNGSKYTMARKDSFMVEVQVGEEEPEDIAVRRFLMLVSDSRVIEQMRNRRYTETKVEERKRRLRERIERRKNKVVDATWEELYGQDTDPKPFETFFSRDGDGNESFFLNPYPGQDDLFPGTYMEAMDTKWGNYANDSSRTSGGYINGPGQSNFMGGYMTPGSNQGGYINQGGYMTPGSNQGGYMTPGGNQGGYMNQQPAAPAAPPAAPEQGGSEEQPTVDFRF